jgi:hypothetical protein
VQALIEHGTVLLTGRDAFQLNDQDFGFEF